MNRCVRCGETPCPVTFSGERSARGASLVRGWWVDGYGEAALAEAHWEGGNGREWVRVSVNHDRALCVEFSAGARVARQNVPSEVLAELTRRFDGREGATEPTDPWARAVAAARAISSSRRSRAVRSQ